MISSTEGEIMSKKDDEKRRKNQTKWARYRWEFMRHNPEYIKAYEKVKILRSETNPSPDKVIKTKHTVNYPYLGTEEAKTEKKLCEKFGLYSDCMVNPEMSFNELRKSPDSMEKNCFFMRTFWQHWATRERDGSHLVIDIDFSKINSLENLKVELNALLDLEYKDIYKEYLKNIYQQSEGSKRIRELDTTLKVGRLRLKGKRNVDIANELIQKDYEDGDKDAEIKANKYYNKFKKLISGGYKELTYP
jgi:hypothetical protein